MRTKNIKKKIKEYFFLNPTVRLRVRQIERELKLPLPSIIRYTKELEQENVLKKTEISNIRLYSANRTSKNYKLQKTLFNIEQLQNLTDFLIKDYQNPTIVVFGSYSKGEDIETSYIDLYLENIKNIKNIKKFENKLKRNIQLFQYKTIKDIKNKRLANNIINGFTLNGEVEVF